MTFSNRPAGDRARLNSIDRIGTTLGTPWHIVLCVSNQLHHYTGAAGLTGSHGLAPPF